MISDRINCGICKVSLVRRRLKMHMKNKHKIPDFKWQCQVCFKAEFETWPECKKHEKSHLTEANKPKCGMCGMKFTTVQTLRNHQYNSDACKKGQTLKKINETPSICKVCTETFSDKQAMRRHILEQHKDIELFQCDKCDIILPTKTYLNLHKRKKHGMKVGRPECASKFVTTSLKCPHCRSTYINMLSLKKHISMVHKNEMNQQLEEIMTSDTTDQSLKEPDKIVGDQEQEKDEIQPNYQSLNMHTFDYCMKCKNVKFANKEAYHEHMEKVHDLHEICDFCEKRFKDKSTIRMHCFRVHKIKNEYQCNLCDHYESNKQFMENHCKNVHDGDKSAFTVIIIQQDLDTPKVPVEKIIEPVREKPPNSNIPKCDTCNLTFDTLPTWFEHCKIVHKRTLVCEECNKCYGTPQSLKKHRKKEHNFVQKYKCDQCETIIKSEYHMKLHFHAAHPGVKCTFSIVKESAEWAKGTCHICNKTFQDVFKVKQHIATVHERRKPFECTMCDKKFACRASTTKHNLIYHDGSEEYLKYHTVPKGNLHF